MLVTKTCPNCQNEFSREGNNARRQTCCSFICARQFRYKQEITLDFPDDFGYWLAGITDGEGCFGLNRNANGRYMTTRFAITLRSDDLPVLQAIHQTLGFGSIHENRTARIAAGKKPLTTFSINNMSGCRALVKIFTKYPLRSKKRVDFGIWTQAVEELSRGEGMSPEALSHLVDVLRRHRNYALDTVTPYPNPLPD